MILKTDLTESNYMLYAAKHYDSVFPDTLEFYEDLKKVVYVKRLFNSYKEKGDLKERLIINHLIILYNMFGVHASSMLFLKLEEHETLLKTFLQFINRMPDKIDAIGIARRVIDNKKIPLDLEVWSKINKPTL